MLGQLRELEEHRAAEAELAASIEAAKANGRRAHVEWRRVAALRAPETVHRYAGRTGTQVADQT
jgi:multidrug resistance efflux pump